MNMTLFCKTQFTIINWRWHGKSRFAAMAKYLKKFLNLTGVNLVMGYGYPKFVFFESENSYGEIGFLKFIQKYYCWFSDTRPIITGLENKSTKNLCSPIYFSYFPCTTLKITKKCNKKCESSLYDLPQKKLESLVKLLFFLLKFFLKINWFF